MVVGGFRRAWLALRRHTLISEINSIHVILAHLEDYLQMSGESLVKVSDETGEAAHKWLDQVLDRTGARVKDLTSDIHGERLQGNHDAQLLRSAVHEDSAGVVLSSCPDCDFKSECGLFMP